MFEHLEDTGIPKRLNAFTDCVRSLNILLTLIYN